MLADTPPLPYPSLMPASQHISTHLALASSPRYTKQSPPAAHSLHRTYQLLVAHLHQWESHNAQPIRPHPLIATEPLWDRDALIPRISSLKDTINNKARKRTTLGRALFHKARSVLFESIRYGQFLKKAPNRGQTLLV